MEILLTVTVGYERTSGFNNALEETGFINEKSGKQSTSYSFINVIDTHVSRKLYYRVVFGRLWETHVKGPLFPSRTIPHQQFNPGKSSIPNCLAGKVAGWGETSIDGNCPGEKLPGGNCPGWWEFSIHVWKSSVAQLASCFACNCCNKTVVRNSAVITN